MTLSKSYKQEQEINIVTKKNTNFIYKKNGKVEEVQENKKAYENMPEELKGKTVIGKLTIPSINLETYILEETNNETLNISVTKLTGPDINKIGNFCITGHNYINSKMFWNLYKVQIGDEVFLTDIFDETVKYKVYEKKEVYPEEIEVLSQDTRREQRDYINNLYIWCSKESCCKGSRRIH